MKQFSKAFGRVEQAQRGRAYVCGLLGESERVIAQDLEIARLTVRKYGRLVKRHGYLEPGSQLPSEAELRIHKRCGKSPAWSLIGSRWRNGVDRGWKWSRSGRGRKSIMDSRERKARSGGLCIGSSRGKQKRWRGCTANRVGACKWTLAIAILFILVG